MKSTPSRLLLLPFFFASALDSHCLLHTSGSRVTTASALSGDLSTTEHVDGMDRDGTTTACKPCFASEAKKLVDRVSHIRRSLSGAPVVRKVAYVRVATATTAEVSGQERRRVVT